MARLSKRISRKDLRQPDQFVTLSRRIYQLLTEEYRAQSAAAAALVVALLLAIWGWNVYSDRQNRLAAEVYSRAVALYHNRKYPEARDAFARLIEDYRSSTYARLGQLYQANIYIVLKQPGPAASVLQDLLNRERSDPIVRQLAFLSLAYSQEAQAQWKQAAGSFSQAEQLQGPFKEEALLGVARCSLASNDFRAALNSYRQYLSAYPDSDRSTEVTLRTQELEAKVKAPKQGK